ncbi:MAG TPA: hypothetical protein VKA60_14580 [Blastocatellia bacterium]|nr:hypothetical protein [Blastocatellia bacterium]
MKDDYLWDGSGEVDPDIEQLEKALGSLRFQAQPLDARIEQQLNVRRPFFWKYAAAAAVVLMALAAAWLLGPRTHSERELHAILQTPATPDLPGVQYAPTPSVNPPASTGGRSAVAVHMKKPAPRLERDVIEPPPASDTALVASAMAIASAVGNPFVDPDTARHIERSQVLLRSFRNSEGGAAFDLAYERQSARQLLAKNVLLRRAADARGNLPMSDLLGSLEPFLLDIANLADAPVPDDVRTIKARMEKKEIITALQVYAAPTLSRAF